MNEKNSLDLDNCFKDLKNPIDLFREWFNEAIKKELNDPNAFVLATSSKTGTPSSRVILLKSFDDKGFVFYTNLDSQKSSEIINNLKASMCFHWKSLLRQIRITGELSKVSDKQADEYFKSREYESKIGAWASKQSSILKSRNELNKSITSFKNKYSDKNNVPRPSNWSGWNMNVYEIEFWLNGANRIHERLKYIKKNVGWEKCLLSP